MRRLAESVAASDVAAEAYRLHGALVCDIASAILDDPSEVTDVVVEVFACLGSQEPSVDVAARRDWLVRETWRRSTSPRPPRGGAGGKPTSPAPTLWSPLLPVHRQVLALACIAGWRCADIAPVLGADKADVHRHLRAALVAASRDRRSGCPPMGGAHERTGPV